MEYHIVTGASRGVGAALVEQLIGPEATVFAVSRTVSDELVELAADRGGSLRWFPMDLSDPEVVDVLMARIARMVTAEAASRITLIANAAQIEPIGLAGTLSTADIALAARLNLVTPIALTQQFVRLFGDTPVPKRVILISSGAARRVMPGLSVYSATKAGINAFVASAQAEVERPGGPEDLRIYAASPGLVDTGMQETLRETDETALPERENYRAWQEEGTLSTPAEAAGKIRTLFDRDDIQPGSFVHYRDL
jgi:benzil reductase ((S)-benzoin forming)